MRVNILIAGKAGQGLNELSIFLSKILIKSGFYVFNHRIYQSLISGGHNFNIICVSDKEVYSHDEEFDIALLLDENSFKIHKQNLKDKCVVLQGFNPKLKNSIFLDSGAYRKVENIYFAGCLAKILNINKKMLDEEIEHIFAGKSLLKLDLEAVEKAYKQGYKYKINLKPEKSDKNIFYLTGAEATGIAAIESGLDIYFGYPMTPATSLLTFLSLQQEKNNFFVFTPENEIAIANSALGASFSGARVMIGSSGGGYDLMTEAISMQGQTEIPLVVYLASRPGPSSGTPTYSSQDDLNLALHSGHGEFPRVVFTPGDIEESYKASKQAFYLAEKFKIVSFILTDKHLAESGFSQEIKSYDLFIKKSGKYPGKEIIRNNSYAHDEKGEYTEEPEIIIRQTDKRNLKKEFIKREIDKMKFETYKIYGNKNSSKILTGFGSTKGAILDSLNKLGNYKYVHVIIAEPFSEKLKEELKKAKEILVIENNSTGQLADLIQKKTGIIIPKSKRILKYDARPFTPKNVIEGVRRAGGR